MSTSDSKLNFRLSPSNKSAKSVDTLNANNGPRVINSPADSKRTNAMTDDECGDVRQTNGKNANEFPFGDISFRFDELKNGHGNHATINSGSSARMDSDDFNYKMVRANGSHRKEYGNMGTGNGAELHHHQSRNQDTNRMPAAIAAMNNAIAQLSVPAGTHHEYENVTGSDATDNNAHRSSLRKSVHSDAKSTFLGLTSPNTNGSSNKNGVDDESHPKRAFDERENVTSVDAEEFAPLLDSTSSAKITTATTRTPASIGQYENVPSNSVCFATNSAKMRAAECDECGGKIRGDEAISSSKWENERDQYCRCKSSSASPTSTSGGGGTMSSAGIDSPTCSNTSMKSAKPITLDNSTSFRMSQSLSQAVYMATTVPQNIKGSNIMGSHTPTRNSLRHSRMLVVNKNYQVPRRRNPLNVRHPSTTRLVYIFHILVGLVVACLGLWLCWWAPSTSAKENSYWSGLILMLSGILGMIVIGYKRIPRNKLRQHLFTFIRVISTFVTFVASICTLVACTFAVMHSINIMNAVCRSMSGFEANSECTCTLNATIINSANSNSTNSAFSHGKFPDGIEYRDLSCPEVMGLFKYILIASSISNFTGFLLCCTLLILLCIRHKRVKRVPYCTATSRNRL